MKSLKKGKEINMPENKPPHPALAIAKLYKTGSINLLEASHRFSFLSGLRLDVSREYLLNVPRKNIIYPKDFKSKQNQTIKKDSKMPKGRPSKKGKELQFKTVAVPEETYKMISELAELEERSIARQLGVVIKNAHQNHFSNDESLNKI